MRTPSLDGVSFTSELDGEVVQRAGSTCGPVRGSDHTGAAEAGVENPTAVTTTVRLKRSMTDGPKRKPLSKVISYWEEPRTRSFLDSGPGGSGESTDVQRAWIRDSRLPAYTRGVAVYACTFAKSSAVLLSLLAATTLLPCACGHGNGSSTKDRLEKRMPDQGCADELPAGATDTAAAKERVVQVVFNGDVFLGLSVSLYVAVLDPDTQTTRRLWRGRFGALAEDGSVGLAFGPDATKGVALEVWDLASDQKLGAKPVDDGLADLRGPQALAVARRAVVFRQGEGECRDCQDLSAVPSSSTVVHWDLATDKLSPGIIDQACGAKSMLSTDGRYFLCVSGEGDHVSWNDLASGAWPSSLSPASDWRPSARAKKDGELPVVEISSARLSRAGTEVYLAYRRSAYPDESGGRAPRRGWRLERWTPTSGDAPARVKVLASEPVQLCTDLLAVSPDGKLTLFGGANHRVTVRRAPDYAAVPLGESTKASSAAFSSDGAWFVTGHDDGHMELWDAKTLKSRLSVHPKWRSDD